MTIDCELQKSVMRELAWDTRVDETAIGVSAHHGVVTLNGIVGSWAEKHAAEEAAHRVAGVLDVANDIEIKPGWSTKRSDTEIAEAVRRVLEWDVFLPQRQIQSTVSDGGHVTLTGTVATRRQRDDAERIVRRLRGVRLVTNEIALLAPSVTRIEPSD